MISFYKFLTVDLGSRFFSWAAGIFLRLAHMWRKFFLTSSCYLDAGPKEFIQVFHSLQNWRVIIILIL